MEISIDLMEIDSPYAQ